MPMIPEIKEKWAAALESGDYQQGKNCLKKTDPIAGTHQQEVDYYRPVLKDLGVKVPESMFTETRIDQRDRVGNRVIRHDPFFGRER